MKDIRELIYATYLLHKLEPNLEHVTLQIIKRRASRNIRNKVRNIQNINIFIERLIQLEHYIDRNGFRHYNYEYRNY